MNTCFVVWSFLLAAISLIWASRHLAVNRAQRGERPLCSSSFKGPPEPVPAVSVIVAAKDEQANIESCVTTLLSQDYPDLEVIAVNDRSTDSTPEILDRLSADNHVRYHTIHITELPSGWFGKNNAMRAGVEKASGEWLCFTDADCRQVSQRTISMAVAHAVANDIDFLSVLPVLDTRSFWERVLQPVCAAIMIMWFRPERVNDPGSRAAYANGAFMLLRRDLYNSIGGHESTRTEVNEDMHLARLTKEAGWRLHVMQNEDLYRTRMYANFKECWHGWSRIFYGCFGSLRRLLITTFVLLLASIFPWASLLTAAVGWSWSTEFKPWGWLTVFSTVAVLAQLTLLARFYRINQADSKYIVTYPVGAVIALGMLLNAMTKLGGLSTTTWRGTTYRGTALASGVITLLDNQSGFGLLLAATGVLTVVWIVLKVRGRRSAIKLHPRLQKYGGPDAEYAQRRRAEAEKILATSSTSTIAGFMVVRQIEAVFIEGFRRPEDALEGIKAVAAMKGANAIINLQHERSAGGKCSASGDAVLVEATP